MHRRTAHADRTYNRRLREARQRSRAQVIEGGEGGTRKMLLRKKLAVVLAATLMLALSGAPAAFAAPNPSGTGQPGAECGDEGATEAPAGFATGGFAHAETVYAGSEDT